MIHVPYVLVNLQSSLLHFGKGLENSHHHIADLSSQEEHRVLQALYCTLKFIVRNCIQN